MFATALIIYCSLVVAAWIYIGMTFCLSKNKYKIMSFAIFGVYSLAAIPVGILIFGIWALINTFM